MDIYSGEFVLTILVNLVITIIGYCTLPFILRLKNGKYEYEKGHKIVIINCIVVWLIFTIIRIEQGNTTSTGAAVFLYYFVNRAILLKPKTTIQKNIEDENEEKFSLSLPNEEITYNKNSWNVYGKDLKVQETIESDKISEDATKNTEKKKLSKREKDQLLIDHLLETEQKLKIGLIISIIIIIILGISCLLVISNSNTEELEKEISSLKSKVSKLSEENTDYFFENMNLKDKADFLDENIVFVIDGYGRYYYTYDQMEQVTQGIGEYSYWAYNKEAAISQGYKAWKK